VDVGLFAAQDALLAQGGDDRLLGLGDGHPGETLPGLLGETTVGTDRDDLLEPVFAADLEVVGVVPGGDLQRPSAELGVDVLVGNNRQAAADQRQDAVLADQVAVALVGRIHGDGGVGEHRLRAHRGDGQDAVGALDRVVDRVEGVLDLAVLDLEVGDRRVRARIPVDHVVVAIDVALVEELLEDAVDGLDVAVVQGEALALVVAGGAEPLVLLDDPRAVLLTPLPDPLDELLAAEVVTRNPFGAQHFLHHRLGGDAGVVGAEDPERVAAPHPVHPHQRVLHRPIQRVPHVQGAGHVRRRDRDREILLRRAFCGRVEIPRLHPFGKDPTLDLSRVVAGLLLQVVLALAHRARV
jgi:hypothetical protein